MCKEKKSVKKITALYNSAAVSALLFFLLSTVVFAAPSDNARKFFGKGELQFSSLYTEGVRESRQNWINCGDNFKKAYDSDPKGDYAPVSLYFYGKVYRDLHRFSANPDDLETARAAFRKLASTFPQSTYSHKAEAELEGMPAFTKQSGIKDKTTRESEKEIDKESKTDKQPVKIDSSKIKSSADNIKTASKDKIAGEAKDKNSISEKKPQPTGIKKEIDLNNKSIEKKAEKNQPESKEEGTGSRKKDGIDKADDPAKESGKAKPSDVKANRNPIITGIRHWTENGYTRVVIDTDSKVSYKYGVEKNKSDELDYLVIDFKGCVVPETTKKDYSFKSKVVRNASIREKSGIVRVSLGMASSENFNVFPLPGPSDSLRYRIVIDVKGEPKKEAVPAQGSKKDAKTEKDAVNSLPDKSTLQEEKTEEKQKKESEQPEKKDVSVSGKEKTKGLKEPSDSGFESASVDHDKGSRRPDSTIPQAGALAKQLALGVRKIIIDPGHGGNDPGAMAPKGVREKDISLAIAKRLAQSIRKRTGCEVALTRSSDTYLHLEERTAIANTQKADLFISLHLNSSPAREAKGIETYFLNLATDESAIAVAARENATSTKNISDLEDILKDLMRNAKIDESKRLAKIVQKSMCSSLSGKYDQVKDKGVKQAPFYVLMGARMPAILIETGFISNPHELSRLMSPDYQAALSDAIADGVARYAGAFSPRQNDPAPKKSTAVSKPATKKTDSKKPDKKKKQTEKTEPVKTVPNKKSQPKNDQRG